MHLAFAVALILLVRVVMNDRRWFAGTWTVGALIVLAIGVVVFVALGLQLRAATLAGPGGEFRQYFGPSLRPDRFLVDFELWRIGYPLLLIGALLGLPAVVCARLTRGLFVYVTIAVTAFTVWVVIAKKSDRYGLVLLPLLAVAASWGIAETVRIVGRACRLDDVMIGRFKAAVFVFVFGVTFVRDARGALALWGHAPTQTWLTEFRTLGPAPGDAVISDTPEMGAVYLGAVQYWDRADSFELYGYASEAGIRHLYTGALKVGSGEEFLALLHGGQPGTLWYIGHGSLLESAAVVRSAALVHPTGDEDTILKFSLGSGR